MPLYPSFLLSERELENCEQGSAEPTGPAKALPNLVARDPDTLKRLGKIWPEGIAAP